MKKMRTPHARRLQASPSGKFAQTSSSVPLEIANREGTAYVHQAISRLVTRILNENHVVPGVSVPLNQEIVNPRIEDVHNVTQEVETQDDNIEHSTAKCDDHQTVVDEKADDTPIVDVDEDYSDNDII